MIASTEPETTRRIYEKQCKNGNVELYAPQNHKCEKAGVVVALPPQIAATIPHKKCLIRNISALKDVKPHKKRKKDSSHNWTKYHIDSDTDYDWGQQMAWRMIQEYQNVTNDRYAKDIEALKPSDDTLAGLHGPDTGVYNDDKIQEKLDEWLDAIQNIAMSSVLESLQRGYRRGRLNDNALEYGIPPNDFEQRHVLLEYQHRMHPDIALFSRRHIYKDRALKSSKLIEEKRAWGYSEYRNRLVFVPVRNGSRNKRNKNYESKPEAEKIISELSKFIKFAAKNKKPDGNKWEVAILAFYVSQEKVIRKYLQKFTGSPSLRHFTKGSVDIKLCTVDSIQGQEADMVFISFSNDTATPFLDNVNRINVAITRARFQCVILADYKMYTNVVYKSKHNSILKELLTDIKTVVDIEDNA